MGRLNLLPFNSWMGILTFGVPVKRLTGTFPYFPNSAASGEGEITLFALNSCLAMKSPYAELDHWDCALPMEKEIKQIKRRVYLFITGN